MLAANGNVGLQQWRRDSSAFIHRSMLTHVIGNPPMPYAPGDGRLDQVTLNGKR
jgi:hypothetical protein